MFPLSATASVSPARSGVSPVEPEPAGDTQIPVLRLWGITSNPTTSGKTFTVKRGDEDVPEMVDGNNLVYGVFPGDVVSMVVSAKPGATGWILRVLHKDGTKYATDRGASFEYTVTEDDRYLSMETNA